MDTGKKFAIGGTVVLLLAVGVRVGLIYHERQEAEKPAEKADYKSDPDDLVFLKKMRPDSLKDEKELIGRTLWVAVAGEMDYYGYAGRKIDGSKVSGILPGAEPLLVKDAIEQAAPKGLPNRIPAGDRQVMLVFTLPKSADPAKEYVVPVGYREAGSYTFSTDDIFFYEDPHKLYSYWTPINGPRSMPTRWSPA